MNGRSLCLAIACLFGLSQFTCADETYDIQWRPPQTGDVKLIRSASVLSVDLHRVTFDGMEIPPGAFANVIDKAKTTQTATTVYRDTVLKTRDNFVISRKRRYQQIESLSNEAPSKHLIQQDVIIDLDGDISCHFPDGPELLGDEVEWLRKEFHLANKLAGNCAYPNRPVKLDEEWTVDARTIGEFYAQDFAPQHIINPVDAKVTGVLNRVYQRDGIQYGVMRIKIRLPYEEAILGPDDDEEQPSGSSKIDERPGRPSASQKLTPYGSSEIAADSKKPQPSERSKPKEITIETTLDTPIDGASGPSQKETRVRLIRTKWDSEVKMELEVKLIVHEKVTPLPKHEVKGQ